MNGLTPMYCAPEVLRGKKSYAADVFAFGVCVLFPSFFKKTMFNTILSLDCVDAYFFGKSFFL